MVSALGRRNANLWLAFLWFAAFAVVLLSVFHVKLEGLAFHTRDFPFYAANFARIFSDDLSKELATNPNGRNLLGFRAMDGHPNVYFDIHISPIKYVLALSYALSGSLYAVFAMYAAIFMLSIAYFIFVYWTVDRREQAFVLIGAGALVLVPSAYESLTYDLRTFILVLPFLVMLVAALDRRRPTVEVVLIAVLGLLIREEAVIFLLLAALYLHFDSRLRVSRILFGIAVAHTALAYAYYGLFAATEYSIRNGLVSQAGLLALVLAFAGLEVGTRLGLGDWAQTLFRRFRPLAMAVFGLPFAAEFAIRNAGFVKALNITALASGLITGPRWHPGVVIALIMGLSVVLAAWPGASRAVRAGIGSAVVVVLAVLAVFNARALIDVYQKGTPRQIVWQIAERLRAVPGVVIVDYTIHQAFFDRDQVVVWERLPSAQVQGDLRFFPNSRDLLTKIMTDKAAYYVLTEPSLGPLLALLHDAGLDDEIEPCLVAADVVVARRTTLAMPCAELGLPAGTTTGPGLWSAVHLAIGQYEAAIQELRESIAADESATGLAALGEALILAGRPVEAMEPVQRAMQLVDVPTAGQLYLLALSKFAQEQYEASAELLETAQRRDRRDLRARRLLVAVYGHLGRAEVAQAVRALRTALGAAGRLPFSLQEAQYYPRFRRAEDSLRYLEGLRKAGVPEAPLPPMF